MVRYNKDVYAERNEAYNALQSALRNIRFVDKLPDDVMPMREVSAFSHKLSRYIKKCPDFVVLTYYLPGARKDSGGIKAVKAVNKRSVLMAFCHLYGDSDSIATL